MGILDQAQQIQEQPSQPMQGNQMQQKQQRSSQDVFDKFIINAMKIIHTPEVIQGLIDKIKNNPDTVDGVGEAAFDIVMRLENSAEENQVPLTARVMINAMNVIVGELIAIIEASGAKKLSQEQRYQAVSYAISKYLDFAVKSGKISKEDLIRATEVMRGKQTQQHQQNQTPGQTPNNPIVDQPQSVQGGM